MAILGAVAGILREQAASQEPSGKSPFDENKVSPVRSKAKGKAFDITVATTIYTVYVTARDVTEVKTTPA